MAQSARLRIPLGPCRAAILRPYGRPTQLQGSMVPDFGFGKVFISTRPAVYPLLGQGHMMPISAGLLIETGLGRPTYSVMFRTILLVSWTRWDCNRQEEPDPVQTRQLVRMVLQAAINQTSIRLTARCREGSAQVPETLHPHHRILQRDRDRHL